MFLHFQHQVRLRHHYKHNIDEDFVGDADLIAAPIIGEAIPSTSGHDSTFVCADNPDTKTGIAEKQQVIAPTEPVSISELENVTCTSDGGDNDDEHVTIPSTSGHDSTFTCVNNPDTKTDIAEKQQVI